MRVTVLEKKGKGKKGGGPRWWGERDLMRVVHDDPMRFNSVAEHSRRRQGVGVNYLGHS